METQKKSPRTSRRRGIWYSEDKRDRQSQRTMREKVGYSLLTTFIFTSVCVMALIFLNGFGITLVPDKIIYTLIAQTVANGAAAFLTVTNWLFSNKK